MEGREQHREFKDNISNVEAPSTSTTIIGNLNDHLQNDRSTVDEQSQSNLVNEALPKPLRTYQCDLCDSRFRSERSRSEHKRDVHFNKRALHFCLENHCNYATPMSDDLKQHMKSSHSIAEEPSRLLFFCIDNHCNFVTSKSVDLQHHIRIQHCNPQDPSVSNYITESWHDNVRNPVEGKSKELLENKSRVYACEKCDFRCRHRKSLIIHKRDFHFNKVFFCVEDDCNFATSMSEDLQHHMKSDHVTAEEQGGSNSIIEDLLEHLNDPSSIGEQDGPNSRTEDLQDPLKTNASTMEEPTSIIEELQDYLKTNCSTIEETSSPASIFEDLKDYLKDNQSNVEEGIQSNSINEDIEYHLKNTDSDYEEPNQSSVNGSNDETSSNDYICSFCSLTFTSRENCSAHMKSDHWKSEEISQVASGAKDEAGFDDDDCDKPNPLNDLIEAFKNKDEHPALSESTYDDQRDDTTLAELACPECSYTFTTNEQFIIHQENAHSGKVISDTKPTSTELMRTDYRKSRRLQELHKEASKRCRQILMRKQVFNWERT